MGAALVRVLDPAGVLDSSNAPDSDALEAARAEAEAARAAQSREPPGVAVELPASASSVPASERAASSLASSPPTLMDEAMSQIAPPFIARLLGGNPRRHAGEEGAAEDAEPPLPGDDTSSVDEALLRVAPPAVLQALANPPESFSAGEEMVRQRQEGAESPGFLASLHRRAAKGGRLSPRV